MAKIGDRTAADCTVYVCHTTTMHLMSSNNRMEEGDQDGIDPKN